MQLITSPPLRLEGARNVRDLGGYTTEDGFTTKTGAFLRGDSLHNLTPTDRTALYRYGVRCVVDLRSGRETERMPYAFAEYPEVRRYSFPLLDQANSGSFEDAFPETMGDLYIGLLDRSGSTLAAALRVMAASPACALFHCTAGKDRTGTLAMLLLKLAHVPEELIVADYSVTQSHMAELADRQKESLRAEGVNVPDYVFESRPEDMEKVLEHLAARYGSCEQYLAWAGMTTAEQAALRRKLLGFDAYEE